jgi:hypothetical protein
MLLAVSCILIAGAALSAVTITVSVAATTTVNVSSALFDVSLLIASHFYAFSAVTSASASSAAAAAAAALAALAALRFLGDRLDRDSVESNGRVKHVVG